MGGELIGGTEVVVKILRPSVRRTLHFDLALLGATARAVGWFTGRSAVDIIAVTREFTRVTRAETNYTHEAENAERLRAYYDDREYIRIPRSFTKLTQRYVLVQERIGGISLASAMVAQQSGKTIDSYVHEKTGSNVWFQLDMLGQEALRTLTQAEYCMIVPHPGNIRLLSDNKIGLIDFGMVAKAPNNQEAFVSILREMVHVYEGTFNPGAFAEAMLSFLDADLSAALRVVARSRSSNYMDKMKNFMDEYVSSQASSVRLEYYIADKRMAKLFNQVINEGNKLGVRIGGDSVMIQRSLNMYLSAVRAIGEAHNGEIHFELLRRCMRSSYDAVLREGYSVSSVHMSEERAYEVVSNWLSLVAEGDRQLFKRLYNGGSV